MEDNLEGALVEDQEVAHEGTEVADVEEGPLSSACVRLNLQTNHQRVRKILMELLA